MGKAARVCELQELPCGTKIGIDIEDRQIVVADVDGEADLEGWTGTCEHELGGV